MLARHKTKLSGALMDRIDIVLRVDQPAREEIATGDVETSAHIRARVTAARQRQVSRFAGTGASCNAEMGAALMRQLAVLDVRARRALGDAHEKAALTMRGHDRVVRVAQTLADLEGCNSIERHHVAES